MKLIDADALLQEFETENVAHNTDLWHITGIKAFIENAPIAYDVDTVVAELEGLKAKYKLLCVTCEDKFDAYELECKCIQISKDIDIVKRGGIDG